MRENNLMARVVCAALALAMVWGVPACSTAERRSAAPNAERPAAAPDAPTTVVRQGDTIVYTGALSDEANRTLQGLIEPGTRTLKISSRGGDIHLGMDLGELVFQHGLNVEVDGHCFSSCANYVFPAGRSKILHRHSLLGWHGGAMQAMHIDDPQMKKMYDAYIGPARAREAAYFQKIGVAQQSTTLGQGPAYKPYAHCVGWRYSLQAMAQLGMRQIVLADGDWQPAPQFDGQCIFTITDATQ